MRRAAVLLLPLLFATLPARLRAEGRHPVVEILAGVAVDGHATPQWDAMLREHDGESALAAVAGLRKPYTAEELAWVRTIEGRREAWTREAARLGALYAPLAAPDARIVLGNRGGEDAFGLAPHVIGFDVSRLQGLYGDGDTAAAATRMDRMFRHEYTHLLQRAWFALHPPAEDTPLARALASILIEGMGNYYSLSEQWQPVGGHPSATAAAALAQLEPRFAARLAALACAREEAEGALRAGLSSGRFDRKWGALPMALWIQADPRGEGALGPLLRDGPSAVWAIAEAHMAPEHLPALAEAREAARACAGNGAG